MSFDAERYREGSREGWEEAAGGWVRHRELIRGWGEPVSQWLVQALELQPGERVLELAGGLGETGMLAAEQVAPMGSVLITDQAEAMIEGARERAEELGVGGVELKVMNAEWIDLPLASVDAVICRWGYMLMADPEAALGETRRVLRPGGRVAAAVWDSLDANPWAALPAQELAARGITQQTGAAAGPGPFALSAPGAFEELLAGAGFTEIELATVELSRRQAGFQELWEVTLDISRSFHDAVMDRPAAEVEELRASLESRFEPYRQPDGSLLIPGRTIVARAAA